MKSRSDLPTTIRDPLIANDWQWWKTRLVKRGPWVPVRLWSETVIRSPRPAPRYVELKRATVNGVEVDPYRYEGWEYWHPINEDEWEVLELERELAPINDDEEERKQWVMM